MPTIEHAGRTIHFEEHGSGPPVLLGHGFLFDRTMWEPQLPALAARARVVVVDFPGHGLSGPVASRVTLGDLTGDLAAVLDHLGIDRAVWGGLSLGGLVALRAATSRPDRVSGLMLLDTDAGRETFVRRIAYRLLMLVVRIFGLRAVLPVLLRVYFGRTTRATRPELVEEWRNRFLDADTASGLRVFDAIVRRGSLGPRLPEIDTPTLVLVGEEDIALPPPRSERIAAGIPGATLTVIPEAGHMSSLEKPALVNDALVRFLEEPT